MSSRYELANHSPRRCVFCTMSSLLHHPLGCIRILQQLQPLGGTVFARSLLMSIVRAGRDEVLGCQVMYTSPGEPGFGQMLWLTPCPWSTCGRKFPVWLLKCCPMCCCRSICCLRDVKKYFLLFPISCAGKFQHETMKRWADCSSWGEAALPLCSTFLCKAAFSASFLLSCFWFASVLLAVEQTNPKCMQKYICILTQEGENCTSDEGED